MFVISFFRDNHIHASQEFFIELRGLTSSSKGIRFLLQSVLQQNVASLFLDIGNAFPTLVTHGNKTDVVVLKEIFQLSFVFLVEFFESHQIDFGHDDDQRLVLKQGLDIVEQRNLLGNGLPTALGNIDKE